MRTAFLHKHSIVLVSLSVTLLLLSILAVAVRVAGYPTSVPRVLAIFLDSFIEPGSTLWWLTIGGAFEGFPHSPFGYAIAIVGNTAFWFVAVVICAALCKVGYRTVRGLRQ